MNAKMRTLRASLARTPYTLLVLALACSVYEPSLLTSERHSTSGGELDGHSGGFAGKPEGTGGRLPTGGATMAGSAEGGATGGAEGGAAPSAGSAGTPSSGGNTGGAPASGGNASGGERASGGQGGSATTGGTVTGGAVSTQGGAGGATSSCAGARYQGLCWHLGPRGASCDATCAAYGGVASGAETFVGTTAQGGSVTECQQLLVLLGVTAPPFVATRDDVGLGCHLYDEESYWLDEPGFTSDASAPEARIVCACR